MKAKATQSTDDPQQLYYGEVLLDKPRKLRFDAGAWKRFHQQTGIRVLSDEFAKWTASVLMNLGTKEEPRFVIDDEKLVILLYCATAHHDTEGYRNPPTLNPDIISGYITDDNAALLFAQVNKARRETDPEEEKKDRPFVAGEGANK